MGGAVGNLSHVTSGIWSKRLTDDRAIEYAVGLLEERPDLIDHGPAVAAWARAEARCQMLSEYYSDVPMIGEDGQPHGALRFIHQFESLAMKMRQTLGLDPKSQADLAKSRADATASVFDLDELKRKGREALGA